MKRSRRGAARLIAAGATLACGAAAACTAFDDVPLPSRPREAGAVDAEPAEAGPVDGGAPDVLPAEGYVTEAEAVTACSVVAACPYLAESMALSLRVAVAETVPAYVVGEHPPYEQSFSFCVEQLSKTFEPQRPGRDLVAATVRKIASAKSCAEAGANLRLDLLPPGDPRCASGPAPDAGPWTCLDDVTALSCDETLPFLWHCSAPYGLPTARCETIDGGAYALGGCVLPDGVCPACEGSVLTSCLTEPVTHTPYRTKVDCRVIGLECAINPGNVQIGCAGPDHVIRGDIYSFPGAYCQNTNLVVSNGTYVGILDCASLGGICASANGAAVCTLPDAACTPFSAGANTCQGSKLHLCVGGRWRDVDCPAGCDVPDGSPQRGVCRASFGDGG